MHLLSMGEVVGQRRGWIVVRFKSRWLRRRGAEGRIYTSWELSDRVLIIVGCLRLIVVYITTAEVDVLWRIWNLLSRPSLANESRDILLNFRVFQRKSDFLA
jgi:hypothetical protein